jgi:hypothetical protein
MKINKKFAEQINPKLRVNRTGRFIEVREPVKGGLAYRVEARGANADTAAAINSRIPCMTVRKPL